MKRYIKTLIFLSSVFIINKVEAQSINKIEKPPLEHLKKFEHKNQLVAVLEQSQLAIDKLIKDQTIKPNERHLLLTKLKQEQADKIAAILTPDELRIFNDSLAAYTGNMHSRFQAQAESKSKIIKKNTIVVRDIKKTSN